MKTIKNIRNKLGLAGSFISLVAIFTAVILAAGYMINRSYGWFASGTEVTGSGMGVTMNGDMFELAVVADPNQRTSYPFEENGTGILNFLSETSNGGYKKINETGAEGAALFCRFVNEKSGAADESIKPGDFGVISFDIIPLNAATRFNISIDVCGAKKDEDDGTYHLVLTGDSDDAERFLRGHIMMFLDRIPITGTNEYYYQDFIEEGGFVFDITNETPVYVTGDSRAHYRVTFYWIWPSTFAQIAYREGDFRLHTHSLFGNTAAQNAQRDAILAYIEEHGSDAPGSEENRFFYECAVTYVAGTGMEDLYYVALSDGYNNADQVIGDTIKYFITRLHVSPAGPDNGTESSQ
ncbi:MAG: hypothetical protein J5793_05065 [Clostridia bacterium]|nr:hypothetical protein [Clostridia bacterium]